MTKIIGLIFLAFLAYSAFNNAVDFTAVGAGVFGMAFIIIPSGRKK